MMDVTWPGKEQHVLNGSSLFPSFPPFLKAFPTLEQAGKDHVVTASHLPQGKETSTQWDGGCPNRTGRVIWEH